MPPPTSTTNPEHSLHLQLNHWLRQQVPGLVDELGQSLLRRSVELGLVLAMDEGDQPIATSLSPEVISRGRAESRGEHAALLLSAAQKTARWVFEGKAPPEIREQLFGHFSPFQQEFLEKWEEAENLAIGRVDWFIDSAGQHFALELNATIPAMEAYSDAAARAWIEVLGRHAGLSDDEISEKVAQNGSNAEELRRSLLAHARLQNSHLNTLPSVAILHRKSDPQRRELESIARLMESKGHRVRLATPDEVSLDANGEALIASERYDLLYRHIFATRLDPESALATVARDSRRHELLNPVNDHLEVKGLLALLSQMVDEERAEGLNLSQAEERMVKKHLPWTRLLSHCRCLSPEGEVQEMTPVVLRSPERFVLKRSWDYGGRSVLIGKDVLETEGAEAWRKYLLSARQEAPGSWIVQELVASPRRDFLVATPDSSPSWEAVFADASTFTASGPKDVPSGGVVRFHHNRVVNIVGGGGVAPLLYEDVAAGILKALKQRG